MKRLSICKIVVVRFGIFMILLYSKAGAENDPDSLRRTDTGQKVQTGWKILPLPAISYGPDLGLQYGFFGNLTYYGNGRYYPDHISQIYFELTRFSKGSGTNMLYFDSGKLLSRIRITADVTYLTEEILNFYGFNGYEAVYNRAWENTAPGNPDYISHVFYTHSRIIFRSEFDLRGNLVAPYLSWYAGFTWLDFHISSVNISRLKRGSGPSVTYPNVPELYDDYVSWGIIKPNEKSGGLNNLIRMGTIYDSRDRAEFPTKGMWSEVIFAFAPGFIGDSHFSFIKLSATHRQYIPLSGRRLIFAYRLAYQGTVAGRVPFYFQPYMITTTTQSTMVDGVGGTLNVRGMLRNRVVGDGVVYSNVELRWRFCHFHLMRQDCYLDLLGFTDNGMVVQEITLDKSGIPPGVDQTQFFDGAEYPHVTFGGGLHWVISGNTLVSADFGHITDSRNGHNGIYVGLDYLF